MDHGFGPPEKMWTSLPFQTRGFTVFILLIDTVTSKLSPDPQAWKVGDNPEAHKHACHDAMMMHSVQADMLLHKPIVF